MARSLGELVARWEEIARDAATFDLTLDDWLNDLDLRDMIDRQIDSLAVDESILRSRLESADRAFREATREAKRSLWGLHAGAKHDATRQWWYFRYPSRPGRSMRHDLETAGIVPRH